MDFHETLGIINLSKENVVTCFQKRPITQTNRLRRCRSYITRHRRRNKRRCSSTVLTIVQPESSYLPA